MTMTMTEHEKEIADAIVNAPATRNMIKSLAEIITFLRSDIISGGDALAEMCGDLMLLLKTGRISLKAARKILNSITEMIFGLIQLPAPYDRDNRHRWNAALAIFFSALETWMNMLVVLVTANNSRSEFEFVLPLGKKILEAIAAKSAANAAEGEVAEIRAEEAAESASEAKPPTFGRKKEEDRKGRDNEP